MRSRCVPAVMRVPAALLAMLNAAACTLLVPFDDRASGAALDAAIDDASAQDGALPPDAGAANDAAADDAARAHCPLYDAAGPTNPCIINKGLTEGDYCACHILVNYAGSPGDLVSCRPDGGFLKATRCAQGCTNFPQGIADACTRCNGQSGTFCGDQLGYDAGAKYLVTCVNGQASNADECAGGCTGSAGSARCK